MANLSNAENTPNKARRAAKRRMADAQSRPTLDFVVIGAMRAATSTFHQVLSECPDLSLPSMKETDYFVPEISGHRPRSWYENQFDKTARWRAEVDPNYAKRDIFKQVPERIAACAPNAKIIYILRDPVTRAVSHFQHSQLMGQSVPDSRDLFTSQSGQHILATSRYYWQIEPWRQHFGDDNILLLDFHQVTQDLTATIQTLNRFLGIELHPKLTATNRRNDITEVGRVPNWWLNLRSTRLGTALRRHIPRGLVTRTKGATFTSPTMPITLPSDTIEMIAEHVRDDTAALRGWSGLKFPDWQV